MVQNVVTSIILYSGTAVDLLIILMSVSYTHLRAHETIAHLVCRLLL